MADKKFSILLAEDEENLQEALKLNLELEGYEVTVCTDGATALKSINKEYFDLIILDVMLPEIDGITVCETVRLKNMDVPILMLSAKSTSADKVLGLKKGADDYMGKPFNLDELLLRIEKLIKKSERISNKQTIEEIFIFGNNKIDFKASKAINYLKEEIVLTKKEVMLLKLLVENKNDVVTREKILQAVWGYNVYPTTRTIDNFVLNFRKYFEVDSKNPQFFQSARGVGYKFTD
jgi:two-component system, OmpR family, alkaline phosphatase synthesis response regulator PhoP